eukprot:scaffold13140_cov81-Cyclotella_meneghiniana.AAC.3
MPVDWQSSNECDVRPRLTPDSRRRHTALTTKIHQSSGSRFMGQTTACTMRLPPNFDSVALACLRLRSQARNEAPARLSLATV